MTATSRESDASKTIPGASTRLLMAIAILAAAGMAVSAVALQRHYAKSASGFCEIGDQFNCDVVNRSEYSSLMGIPVAGIGVAGYGLMLLLATLHRSRPGMPAQLLGASIAGLAFALYLTYIEGYVLETWCVLCLGSLVIIFIIALLSGVLQVLTRGQSRASRSFFNLIK